MKNLGVSLLCIALCVQALLMYSPLRNAELPIPQAVVAVGAIVLMLAGVTIMIVAAYRKNRETRR